MKFIPALTEADQLADIFSVDRDTVNGWLKLWQERRLDGLADAPKSGRFRKIDGSLEAVLRDILIENPSPNWPDRCHEGFVASRT